MSVLAIAFSPETNAVTTYSNFNFTGSHHFKGRTLFINNSGLFEHGGTTDNGTPIQPSLKTGMMNQVAGQAGLIPVQALKKISSSKVYVSCHKDSGALLLNVNADGVSYPYDTAINHSGFATHAIKIGRGLKYNFLQLELMASNCAVLDIESISFDAVAIQRKDRR